MKSTHGKKNGLSSEQKTTLFFGMAGILNAAASLLLLTVVGAHKAIGGDNPQVAVTTAIIFVSFCLTQVLGIIFRLSNRNTLFAPSMELKTASTDIMVNLQKLSDAGSSVSSHASEQAAALQQTVSSIDEISAMVKKNAENAKKSQEFSEKSRQTATRGKQTVSEMITSIEEISQSNEQITQQIETSNKEISDIVKLISEIGNKTKVINDIVFQTKLLSFNASVEAARAGEHGKGFAVVAEEVGNLAQMSGNAAKEISQMLEGSIQKVEAIVNATRSKVDRLVIAGKDKVSTGTATAKKCGEVLDEIVNFVSDVNQMINEITTASDEQSIGVQEITKAMAQLDQLTQENAVAAKETSMTTLNLTNQAENLRDTATRLGESLWGGSPQTVHLESKAKQKVATQANVIPFKGKSPVASPTRALAKVSGDSDIPKENDPRFEDT
jgi:methyl-accepting chemotaxis protein